MADDGRRSQFIIIDSHIMASNTMGGILDQFGPCGSALWFAYLTACKRNLVQGQITVSSDADTLAQLGLHGIRLVNDNGDAFTLDAFWTYLGRMKKVSRTPRGRAVNIRCTGWERWQSTSARDLKRERMRSSRAGNTGTDLHDAATNTDTETDTGDDTDTDTKTDLSPPPLAVVQDLPLLPVGFDAFWIRWPEDARLQEDEARKAWKAALSHGTDVDIMRGAETWAAHWRDAGTDVQWIPYPANWLKKKGWRDMPKAPPLSKGEKQNAEIQRNAAEFLGGAS